VGGSISQGCALGYIPAPRLRLNFWGAFWGDEGGAPSELFWVVRFYFSALTDRANRMAPRRGWWWRGRRSSGLVVGGVLLWGTCEGDGIWGKNESGRSGVLTGPIVPVGCSFSRLAATGQSAHRG
jgi:hypothetical protein